MNEGKIRSRFCDIVGQGYVSNDLIALSAAEKTNYKTTQKIKLIVKPANSDELKDCIIAANELNTPVYPISKGKNWGYGSKVPVSDNNILIELDRLDKILDYNEQLGYVTIEPGVTFQQLFNFLREKKSELIISGTGGPIDSSLIGNAIERGLGTGLYADRFANVCGMEIVLPDGNIISTGFKRFGNSIVSNIYKWGMGPSIDGIFSQSNYGIVTKLTMWLMPCPEYLQLIFYKCNNLEKIPGLINALRDLLMNGLVRPAVTVYNDFRVFSAMMQYPWQSCNPDTNSANDVRTALRTYPGINELVGMWNGEVSVRSINQEHGKMQFDLIKAHLEGHIDSIDFAEVSKAQILEILQDHYTGKFQWHQEDIIKSFLVRKYIGIPDNFPIRAAYWRKTTPIPDSMNPDTDNCGIVWISPVVPFDGIEIKKATDIISNIIDKHHFEPAITFQCLTERAINVIISISWDRSVEGEDEKAEKCYVELNNALNENGYLSYRTTTLSMANKDLQNTPDAYDLFINKIKKAIDPNNILSPGRYNIG